MSVRSNSTGHFFPREYQNESKVPHRHAAPSAPWPWINIHDTVDAAQLASGLPPVPKLCDHKSCDGCWKDYPQSRFPNWTKDQRSRSGISDAIENYRRTPCVTYQADVCPDGIFVDLGSIAATDADKDPTWDRMINTVRPPGIRVRALFVDNLSGPVLQMLGTRFNIEPFFFSSSLNWIPSRYQEEVQDRKGDHVTVTLTFLKSIQIPNRSLVASFHDSTSIPDIPSRKKQMVDTHAPLPLRFTDRQLVVDLLSVHLIRHVDGSTIISFHPEKDYPTTSARYLHERIRFAGRSVYWQKVFRASPDPTFILLTFLWHAIYAWDEALEDLYTHISHLESNVISTSNMTLSRELHIIRAHQLHYSSLLEDFRKTIAFIRATKNPALDSFPKPTRLRSADLMKRECTNLMNEIDRLDMSREMVDKQLKSVMNLLFSNVKIKMTEASVKDSAGWSTRQIAFVTMIYFPASFVAGVFGMNVREINPTNNGILVPFRLIHYAATAISFTVASIWIIIAFQSKHILGEEDTSFWQRLGWPYLLFRKSYGRRDLDT
ncbi:hypothetical protein L208DRAFT_1253151 [Tricholoma matsutake]|nr:hypothetical protein L208DRAFT_1253151 [Tricholoma matsutake 945]